MNGWSRGNHRATARTDTNGARACGAPVGAAGFVVEVVRLTNVGAFWHRHTRGIICVRGSGARLRHALRTRVLLSTSQSQASARFVCDFGWRGMRRARATGDVGKGLGLVVTKRIDDGDATRRYGYDRIVKILRAIKTMFRVGAWALWWAERLKSGERGTLPSILFLWAISRSRVCKCYD